jgi:ADP-ribosylglycohydrolase
MAWQLKDHNNGTDRAQRFFDAVLQHTPESRVRHGILVARSTPLETSVHAVANALGNGSLVTAPDTVPFCIWIAAHHAGDFVEALGKTISAGGDCDTNAAIVGGIIGLSAGPPGIPAAWLQARESCQVP